MPVTAVSESLRLTTLEQLGVSCDIEVIPNFVDIDAEGPPQSGRSAARWRRSDDERLLVHVSNFRPVKRVLDVVEVFERVHKELPSRLLLVGDGPDRAIIERVCAERNLDDHVEFLEQLPRVEEALWGADLFLLTSETESFGLAALEALACGVPVIATRAGGLPEVIHHQEHGLLYEVGDVESMAEGGAPPPARPGAPPVLCQAREIVRARDLQARRGGCSISGALSLRASALAKDAVDTAPQTDEGAAATLQTREGNRRLR